MPQRRSRTIHILTIHNSKANKTDFYVEECHPLLRLLPDDRVLKRTSLRVQLMNRLQLASREKEIVKKYSAGLRRQRARKVT